MAEIARGTKVRLATELPCPAHQETGLYAGEALTAGDLVYIKASDNMVYKASGAANDALALYVGMVQVDVPVGEPATYWEGVDMRYSDGALTPGKRYYLSGTVAGGIADAASTGGTTPVGYGYSPYILRLFHVSR